MIQLDTGLFGVILSLLGAGLLAGIGWIVRTLLTQNNAMAGQTQALAVLVARVDPTVDATRRLETAVTDLNSRVLRLELAGGLHNTTSAVTVNAS